MQEYYNFDTSKITLSSPQPIGEKDLIIPKYNKKDKILFVTPPLLCNNIKIWKKNNILSKCLLYFELSDNEWRFKKVLENISKKCKQDIAKKGKRWFGSMFSISHMEKTYKKLLQDKKEIELKLSNNYLKTIKDIKKFKNKIFCIKLKFTGVLVEDGICIEKWIANDLIIPTIELEEDDISDISDYLDDIGETINIDTPNNLEEIKVTEPENPESKVTEPENPKSKVTEPENPESKVTEPENPENKKIEKIKHRKKHRKKIILSNGRTRFSN